MRRIIPLLTITILLVLAMPNFALADPVTDVETVRRMCTLIDNQDFSFFDQELLPGVLIEIVRNDPETADYHDRVVSSALKALGRLHADGAVAVLVEKLDEYPYICLYWLGTWTEAESVEAIVSYFDSEDLSMRYEAVTSFISMEPVDEYDEELQDVLNRAGEIITARLIVEDDVEVLELLEIAEGYVDQINPRV